MKRLALLSCLVWLVAGPVLAVDTARPALHKKAAAKQMAAADRLAITAEEKDRLAREKKEMEERAALLQLQLETSKKLVAEKEAYLKQLQNDIKALKADK